MHSTLAEQLELAHEQHLDEWCDIALAWPRYDPQHQHLSIFCCSLPCCCCCVVVVALPPGSSSRHQRRCALTMAAQSPREIASDCGGSSSPVAVSSSECVEQQRQPSNIDGGGSPATTTRTSTNNINARSSSSSDGCQYSQSQSQQISNTFYVGGMRSCTSTLRRANNTMSLVASETSYPTTVGWWLYHSLFNTFNHLRFFV